MIVADEDGGPEGQRLDRLGVHGLLRIPLAVGGEHVGVLELFRADATRFNRREIERAEIAGAAFAAALERLARRPAVSAA